VSYLLLAHTQEATAQLVDAAIRSSGGYGQQPREAVLDAMMQLVQDIKWHTIYLSAAATPVGILEVCRLAAEQGWLPNKAFDDEAISQSVMWILYSCGECLA
jgi:hypothetical protein